jgi:hypothetical protein
MSVPVEISELESRVGEFGRTPFLVTTGDDLRPHTTHVVVGFDGGDIVANIGRKTAHNASSRPLVALLWMPTEAGGYSLIVDGESTVDDSTIRIRPTKGILHRNAGGESYAADCLRLDGTRP